MAVTGGGFLPYLGTIGNMYMGLLIVILVIALGLLARKIVSEKTWVWGSSGKINKTKTLGGLTMFNKWFKLALVSFLGIIISGFALGLMNTAGMAGTTGVHSGMNMAAPMGTTAAGNMAMGMPMATTNDNVTNQQMNIMMQRMNDMMMQMNVMMNNMAMMNNMNTGGMAGMSGMGSMSPTPPSGGMGMMNMPMMGMPMGGMGMMNMGSGSMGGGSMGSMSGGGTMSGGGMSGGTASGGGGGGSMGGMSMM